MPDLIKVNVSPHESEGEHKLKHRERTDHYEELVESHIADLNGNAVGVTSGGLNVAVVSGAAAGGTSMVDDAAFTVGASAITPVGGTYRAVRDAVDSGDAGAFAMTETRALFSSLETPNGDSAMDDVNDAVRVNIIAGAGSGGTAMADDAAFLPGATSVTPVAGTYRSVRDAVDDNDVGALAINPKRGVYATLETSASVEAGTAASPLRTDPTGTTAQPVTDNGGSLTVDGTITANLAAGTNNIGDVDVLSLPALPAGTNNIGDVDVLSLPAIPTGDNGIGRVKLTDGTDVADVLDLTNSNPLTVAIVDGDGTQITSFGGGTQYTEADTDATITGTALMWEDTSDTLRVASAAKPLPVNIVAGSASGVQYTEADVDATITGTALMWEDAADTLRAVSAAKPLPIGDAGGSLTVDGTVAVSGTVTVDGSGVTQPVSAASLPLPAGASTAAKQPALGTAGVASADVITVQGIASGTALPVSDNGGSLTVDGTVTANAGTNLNTSALALEAGGNLAAIAASASILDDWDETDRAKVNIIAGQVGVAGGSGTTSALTQRVVLATDVALPAGTNAIGKLAANSGIDIGDVDVTSLPAIPAGDNAIGRVKLTDGTDVADILDLANSNPLTVALVDGDGTHITSIGGGVQYTEADTDATITGTAMMWEDGSDTLRVASAAKPLPVGDGGGSLTVDGTVTANAGTNLNTSALALEAGGNLAGAATSLAIIDDWDETDRAKVNIIAGQVGVQGGSGTTNALTQRVVLATDVALPTGANVIGALTANQSVNVAQINGVTTLMGNGASGTGAQRVTIANDSTGILAGVTTVTTVSTVTALTGGGVAHDAADSGNPVKVGGKAVSAEPTAVTANDRSDFFTDLVGKHVVLPFSIPELLVNGSTSDITGTSNTSLIAASGAGVRTYLMEVTVTNSHATVGTWVNIKDDTTTKHTVYCAAAGGGAVITFPIPLRGTANVAWNVACETTGSNVRASAVGYKGV